MSYKDVLENPDRISKVVLQKGLEAGQRVVVSGQFLVDSEASLKGVLARLAATAQEGGTTVIKIEPTDPQVVYVPQYEQEHGKGNGHGDHTGDSLEILKATGATSDIALNGAVRCVCVCVLC